MYDIAHLGSVVVHGQHAGHVEGVTTFSEFAHGVGLKRLRALSWDLITRRAGQALHTDNTVLKAHSQMSHIS